MASAVASEIIGANLLLMAYDHDPGADTAIITSPDGGTTKRVMDLSNGIRAFGVQVRPTIVAGNGVVKVEIVAAENAAMSANLTVIKDSGAIVADSLNDVVFLEALASEIRQLGAALRYVAARITMATSTDEANVTYIGWEPRFRKTGLTATLIT